MCYLIDMYRSQLVPYLNAPLSFYHTSKILLRVTFFYHALKILQRVSFFLSRFENSSTLHFFQFPQYYIIIYNSKILLVTCNTCIVLYMSYTLSMFYVLLQNIDHKNIYDDSVLCFIPFML